jgi:hypothetical protein
MKLKLKLGVKFAITELVGVDTTVGVVTVVTIVGVVAVVVVVPVPVGVPFEYDCPPHPENNKAMPESNTGTAIFHFRLFILNSSSTKHSIGIESLQKLPITSRSIATRGPTCGRSDTRLSA